MPELKNQTSDKKKRCSWVHLDNPLSISYHDNEWGIPCFDDNKLFEMLILDGAQAGLSWNTILNKRENYRRAFDDFDPAKVSKYDEAKLLELLENKGIVRNRRKISSAIKNAKVFMEIKEEFGNFSDYIWNFTGREIIESNFDDYQKAPCRTELSEKISKDLKKRGMSFVGPTIIYSYLQAAGIVNDHQNDCFCKR